MRTFALVAVVAAGFSIRIMLVPAGGDPPDLAILYKWYWIVATHPLALAYPLANVSYPPMFVLLDAWEHGFLALFAAMGFNADRYPYWIVKGPALVGDAACAALVAYLAPAPWRIRAMAFVWLNPAVIYDSAYWGQNDSIPMAFALGALALRSTPLGLLALVIGALVKPPVILLAPIFARCLKPFAVGAAISLLVVQSLAWVFFSWVQSVSSLQAFAWIVAAGAHLYPWNSVNAFNLWAIAWPFYVPESSSLFGIPLTMQHVGFTLLVIGVVLSFALPPFEAAVLSMLAFFCFPTEVHERYLFYAAVLCAPLLASPLYRVWGLIFSATLFLNMQFVLPTLSIPFPSLLIHLLSALNVIGFVWIAFCSRRTTNEIPSWASLQRFAKRLPARMRLFLS